MALNGFFETWLSEGAINTSSFDWVEHNFPPSRVWARPLLQRIVVYDDDSQANAYVTQTVVGGQTDHTNRPGVALSNCTRVVFRVDVTETFARYACVTIFF